MRTIRILPTVLLLAAFISALPGCSSSPDPLAPTQAALALDKSFKLAVDATAAFPIERQRQLLPYEDEGSKILDALAAKTNNFTKPLTVADFGAVALQIAPDLAEILSSKLTPTIRPATEPSTGAIPPPPPNQ